MCAALEHVSSCFFIQLLLFFCFYFFTLNCFVYIVNIFCVQMWSNNFDANQLCYQNCFYFDINKFKFLRKKQFCLLFSDKFSSTKLLWFINFKGINRREKNFTLPSIPLHYSFCLLLNNNNISLSIFFFLFQIYFFLYYDCVNLSLSLIYYCLSVWISSLFFCFLFHHHHRLDMNVFVAVTHIHTHMSRPFWMRISVLNAQCMLVSLVFRRQRKH